jgi:hypothetical protein
VVVICGAALVGSVIFESGQLQGLSIARVLSTLDDLRISAVHSALPWLEASGLPTITGMAGLLAAWLARTRSSRRRLRRSSLLLVDARTPDMAFIDGIQHVCIHAGQGGTHQLNAAKLLLTAARDGKLSLWRRAPSDMLHRVSPRHLRQITPVLQSSLISPPDMLMRTHLYLMRSEIDRLWPSQAVVQALTLISEHEKTA